jgi:hypothetical protein
MGWQWLRVLFVALAGGGARQIASVSRSAKCLPRAFRANFWVRSGRSLTRSVDMCAKGCINNQRNLQRPKAGRGGAAAPKKRAPWLMTERGAAHFLQKTRAAPAVCVHRVNVLERCLCKRLTETSRARQFAKPPESIKSAAGEEIQFDVRLSLFFAVCRPQRMKDDAPPFFWHRPID